jgi:serine/threonine-protein kinase
LQHAHEQGIVHRDLKPSNLMVLADGTLKLTDFGIAKDLDGVQLTSANCTVGTASYMSPEQCKGDRNIGHKSDLYSLGVVLYELLTGVKPFEATSAMDMFLKHVQGKFERPSRVVMDIPPWLDTLVCHLLAKKIEERPFDAAVVSAALDQVVEKVSAQRSAGVDAITGGSMTGGRSASRTTMTGEDRTAARTLAQGIGKSKRKRKSKPFYKSVWFQALGLVLALLFVGGLIFLAVRPPDPDLLYEQAKQLMESGDPSKRLRAREGPLSRYLQYHRKHPKDPEQLRQVEAWVDEFDAEQREAALLNRMKISITPDTKAESAARSAIRQEDAGEFNRAVETWEGLLKYETAPDENGSRVDALVARKRLRDLKAADERLLSVRKKVDLKKAGQDLKGDSESEELAMKALRYELFGDAARAVGRWQALKLKNEGDGGDRTWMLIAARQAKEQKAKMPPPEEEKAKRRELLQEHLKAAEQMVVEGKTPKAIQELWEVQELYDDDPAMQEEVARAKQLLKKLRVP